MYRELEEGKISQSKTVVQI